ncbi:ankyrin [Rozella allomycis CSF55]|uniref:Ankyrin n=1 Tax=Rozella allomycis (strain CSF55) TaxID=988480 RepID=A0A075AQ71_ROZAC|nr:hypothetical protein O9G_002135 [Rozella allomycis CSF55]RKP16950.1 ankyrin [Rozella allomycis CSF55]|eukprot:EPZ32295.1 hypothetical protein O9G_002135 [Rozella allomycis CSF55]
MSVKANFIGRITMNNCNLDSVVKRAKKEFNVLTPSEELNTTLNVLLIYGCHKIYFHLLENPEYDPSLNQNEAIRLAARYGHTKIVERLLKHSKVNPADMNSEALRKSAKFGHIDIVKVLLKDGRCNPAANDNESHLEVVKTLSSDLRVDLGSQNDYAFREACFNGHLDVVTFLMVHPSVNPGALNNEAIQFAAFLGMNEIVKLLLQHPLVDPGANNQFALRNAIQNGHLDVVQSLLKDRRVDSTLVDQEALQYVFNNNGSYFGYWVGYLSIISHNYLPRALSMLLMWGSLLYLMTTIYSLAPESIKLSGYTHTDILSKCEKLVKNGPLLFIPIQSHISNMRNHQIRGMIKYDKETLQDIKSLEGNIKIHSERVLSVLRKERKLLKESHQVVLKSKAMDIITLTLLGILVNSFKNSGINGIARDLKLKVAVNEFDHFVSRLDIQSYWQPVKNLNFQIDELVDQHAIFKELPLNLTRSFSTFCSNFEIYRRNLCAVKVLSSHGSRNNNENPLVQIRMDEIYDEFDLDAILAYTHLNEIYKEDAKAVK